MFTEAQLRKHQSQIGKKHSAEHIQKIRNKCLSIGIKPPVAYGSSNNKWKGGPSYCIDCGKKLSLRKYTRCRSCASKGEKNPHFGKRGCLASNWKLGITPFYLSVRNLFEYRQWKSDVMTRDGFICVLCGTKNKLTAHHITSFHQLVIENNIQTISDAVDCAKLWDINNGVTFCKDCHKKTHDAIGWKINNNINVIS